MANIYKNGSENFDVIIKLQKQLESSLEQTKCKTEEIKNKTKEIYSLIEEKTSRIIEVMISSVKPFQLMMGKIIGIAMVGLTKNKAWQRRIYCCNNSAN